MYSDKVTNSGRDVQLIVNKRKLCAPLYDNPSNVLPLYAPNMKFARNAMLTIPTRYSINTMIKYPILLILTAPKSSFQPQNMHEV